MYSFCHAPSCAPLSSSSSYTYLSCTSHHASIWLSLHFISSPTAIVQLSILPRRIVRFILANKQKCIHAAWKVDDERRKNLVSTLPCMLFVCAVCFTMGHVINIKDYQQQTKGHDDGGKDKERESDVCRFPIYTAPCCFSLIQCLCDIRCDTGRWSRLEEEGITGNGLMFMTTV